MFPGNRSCGHKHVANPGLPAPPSGPGCGTPRISPGPRQHEIPGVVGEEPDVAPPHLRAPANKPVAWPQMPRRRGPCQTRHRPLSGKHHVLELFTDGLRITQVMMMLDESIE